MTDMIAPLPERPRLVLRLGFAGRRDLSPTEWGNLDRALDRVLGRFGQGLAALAAAAAGPAAGVVAFYDRTRPPLLRLVTGLCEGADTAAALALERLAGAGGVETELAAVLPFDLLAYRASRQDGFQAEFDRQAARCTYIVALDGRYDRADPGQDPDAPPVRLARRRRQRAYRAQSRVLLRQVDLLLAAADPDAEGKPGGTLETVGLALAAGLPVVFIHSGDAGIRVLDPACDPGQDLAGALAEPLPDDVTLDAALDRLVTRLLAAPEPVPEGAPARAASGAAGPEGLPLLAEFFRAEGPRRDWADGLRAWAWRRLRRQLGPPVPAPATPEEATPFHRWRDRARRLNYHYSDRYRGAFVLGYGLAVLAVLLATLSLVLLGEAGTELGRLLQAILGGGVALAAGPGGQPQGPPVWLVPTLAVLGLLKLAILWFLARNARQVNRGHWSDLAVDHRYLAERLRALYYLPLVGSFRPPGAAAPQYASRVVHQSAVDWLFNALVRAVSPAAFAETVMVARSDGGGEYPVRLLRLAPQAALPVIRDRWVAGQVGYHADNARAMRRLARFTEAAARVLSVAVVGVVVLDLLLLLLSALGPAWLPAAGHRAAPWLMFLAALLPAAVAALNGLRFQSECERLAERSEHLRTLLRGRRQELDALDRRLAVSLANPAEDPGAWAADLLAATERVAEDCVREVAEWSVLYAKALPEG